MKLVFVFGGSGFIGTNLVGYLLKKKFKVFNIDNQSYSSVPEKFKFYKNDKNYFFKKIDMLDQEKVEKIIFKHKPDYIFNLAALSHVDRSIDNPKGTIVNNIISTLNLLEVLKKAKNKKKIKRVIHLSTDEVYGDVKSKSMEKDILLPSSPYSSSKACCDQIIHSYVKTFELPIIIIRACNNFGPYQFPEKFIPTIILNLLEKKKIPIYGDGKQKREWIYVNDFCQIITKFLSSGKIGQIYNVGSGNKLNNYLLAKYIFEIMFKKNNFKNFKECIKYVQDRPAHDKNYSLDIEKTKKILGKIEKKDFKINLLSTVKWYNQNKFWIKFTKKKYSGKRQGTVK